MLLRTVFLCLLSMLCFLMPGYVSAQTDSAATFQKNSIHAVTNNTVREPDEEFDLFLFTLAICFISVSFGLIAAGTFLVILFLLLGFALVSMGILSTSVIIGLHKKSFSGGFKSLLLIVGGLSGLVLGGTGLWLLQRIFHFALTGSTLLMVGSMAGFAGGLLTGLIVFKITRSETRRFKNRLSLR